MAINIRVSKEDQVEEVKSSILTKYSTLDGKLIPAFANQDNEEGVKYINISKKSNSELGRMLAPTYSVRFKTFLGNIYSIKSFIEAIVTPGYPLELLTKPRLTKKDFEKIPSRNIRKNHLANYWALVAYALCQRVKGDTKLQSLLASNKLPFTVYTVNNSEEFFGKIINVVKLDYSLARYVGIIRYIETMIKSNTFTKTNISQFIENCKDSPDKDLLDGIALNIEIIEKNNKQNNKATESNIAAKTLEVTEIKEEPKASVIANINLTENI